MLKSRRYLLLSIAVVACIAIGLLPGIIQAQDDPPDAVFSSDTLGNMAYLSNLGKDGIVTLVDGHFKEGESSVTLTGYTAYGDLNGDEIEDAAVVLVTNLEDSGVFVDMAIVVQEEDVLTNITSTLLGENIDLIDLAIEDGQIVVDLYTQASDDPTCCPTLPVQRIYELGDEGLILISEEAFEGEAIATFSPENDATVATIKMGDPQIFWLDPMMVTVHSGAIFGGPAVDASLLGIGCAGFIDESPDVVLDWTATEDTEQLRIFMLSLGDPTLVVVTPEGDILCNDDFNPLVPDPYLEIANPVEGLYAIYVGSFDSNATAPGFLTFTTQDFSPATLDIAQLFPRQIAPGAVSESMSMDVLQIDGEPLVQAPQKPLTVEDTPFTQEMVAGGELGAYDIELDNDLCTGFISPVPTFKFDWEGEADKLVLFFEADADTTLVVQNPNGTFQCDDDADGAANLNPYLDLTPIPGSYALWVGSFEPSTLVTGTLTIAGSTEIQPKPLTTNAAQE